MNQKVYDMLAVFGSVASHWSIVADQRCVEIMETILKSEKIHNALEIGTHHGASAVLLAQYCDHLYTIDCEDFPEKHDIWKHAKLGNVTYFTCRDDAHKAEIINGIDFDFAFIDGSHREGAVSDWEMVKKCGRVLFHDYAPGLAGYEFIANLVDSLPKEETYKEYNFAYWRKA